MAPLVSILIPAYNSERWLAETLRSALSQTWRRKEIIVVDDGSTDRTAEVARSFESTSVKCHSGPNRGASEARNTALRLAQGDYIQWLDADDLLSPRKIEHQLSLIHFAQTYEKLLSCPWAAFFRRPASARLTPTQLWADLDPLTWLVLKYQHNLHQQTATWLTPRAIADRAGPWDPRLLSDDDGEYFSRVLLCSSGTRFCREELVYYRVTPGNRLSSVGNSAKKKSAMVLSLELCLGRLLELERSPRVALACLSYLSTWAGEMLPLEVELTARMERLAARCGGALPQPQLSWKYATLAGICGIGRAKAVQRFYNHWKTRALFAIDSARARLPGSSEI